MKIGRIIAAAACALLLVSSAMPSQAAPEWFRCEVIKAGPATKTGIPAVYLKLTHQSDPPQFESKWFKAVSRWEREILAVGLAAMGSDTTVLVKTDALSADPYPDILGIYLNDD